MKNDIRGPFVSIRGSFSPRDARQKCRAGAPTRANHALPSALSSLLSTLGYSSTVARQNCRAGAHTRANHALPSTLSSLLPTLGSPLHSVHALPSPPFSLLSTFHSNKSPCEEEIVGVEDSGLPWGDGVDALWERGGDPSTGEWSERAGDRHLDRTRL